MSISSQLSTRLCMALLFGLGAAGCANKAGDDVTCPTCNNTTEILVGTKCVALAQVEACGPDGHAHGSECHCFSGQQPTAIGGAQYCLQASCGTVATDPAAQACDEMTRTPEAVVAVTAVSEMEKAHVDTGKVAEITLPLGVEAFVHFEADKATEMLVHASVPGVIQGALTAAGVAIPAALEGSNEDCAATLPEVWGVQVPAPGPVILRLQSTTAATIKLVINESGHAH